MVLEKGEQVFVVTRRLFLQDLRRHFVGEVLETTETVMRVRGYVYVYDDNHNDFVRRDEVRTRIFSLTDAGYIINIIPSEINLDDLGYELDKNYQRVITDGKTFKMNVSEFSTLM